MNLEPVIGLEIHVEMKTKSKMFSSSPVTFNAPHNSSVTPYDLAFPGTMPVVNKQAIINGIRMSHALHMEIDDTLYFDRKNYFYSDLPKGFQITQQRRPIGKNGYVEIKTPEGIRKIGIERLHLEEDTCKQLHFIDYTLLDYNRAGVPLAEIVSRPEIKNGYEAMKYVEAIRNIAIYTETSDGKMEEGSLRCDVNISLKPYGTRVFGTKVEIKNLNSLKNIQEAIDYEIVRQSKVLLSGGKVQQETRRFDESKGQTILMRVKTDAVDYKYFCEPNITPIKLGQAFIDDAVNSCPELYDDKFKRYLTLGLNEKDCEIILNNRDMSRYFENAVGEMKNAKGLANLLITEINAYLNKQGITITSLTLKPETLREIVLMGEKESLSHKQVTDILDEVLKSGITPKEAKEKLHIVPQISDSSALLPLVTQVLDNNPQSIIDFKNGKDRAIGFLIGQVMKLSKGKANAAMVSKLMNEELRKR